MYYNIPLLGDTVSSGRKIKKQRGFLYETCLLTHIQSQTKPKKKTPLGFYGSHKELMIKYHSYGSQFTMDYSLIHSS